MFCQCPPPLKCESIPRTISRCNFVYVVALSLSNLDGSRFPEEAGTVLLFALSRARLQSGGRSPEEARVVVLLMLL